MRFIEANFGLIYGCERSNLPYWMILLCSWVKFEKLLPLKD